MYDLLIIGSGPAGLSAAVYASRAKLHFAVIERETMASGQIAYTERVDNYLGYYVIDGFSLGEKFRGHAEALGTEFLDGEVTGFQRSDCDWSVVLSDGTVCQTRTVIYAAGARPKMLDIAGERDLSGRGVSYCALCDGAFFAEKTAAVVGGGDTALQDALYLSKLAEKVLLIHRRVEFRANESLQEQVRSTENIELVLDAVPLTILGTDTVTGIQIRQNGVERQLKTDGVFVAVGTIPNTDILKGVVHLDNSGYIVAGEDCVTSANGFFAAGDVRTKPVRQVITAAADGANAVVSAAAYLQGQ